MTNAPQGEKPATSERVRSLRRFLADDMMAGIPLDPDLVAELREDGNRDE